MGWQLRPNLLLFPFPLLFSLLPFPWVFVPHWHRGSDLIKRFSPVVTLPPPLLAHQLSWLHSPDHSHSDTYLIMPFFENIRRKKGASKTERLSKGIDSPHAASTGTVKTTKSSSTLNSLYGPSTPPSTIQPQSSTPNLINGKSMNGSMSTLPQRPVSLGLSGNRNSMIVCLSLLLPLLPPVLLEDDLYINTFRLL